MILTGGAIDSALACFYNPSDPSHFRLSLLSFQLDQQGALKTTSLKRQSFMLGQDGNKTAYHRLQDFKKSKLKSIQTINEIFSLERVTKEFFDKISKHFEILSQSITFPQNLSPDEKRQFALRLIARVLFCKFLEKKEILPKEILSSNTTKSNDYYHEVLESLFFLTLNTPRESRHYGLLPDSISSLLQSIPYLNGGLFQPHPQDFFHPAKPTAYYNDLKVPSEDIYDFLDTLNQFHFTIDESTPLDEEIGLDPEMLGMVFEKLLNSLKGDEIQNETKKQKNKQKTTGSYYTPREIVSYMVRSSTLKYLCDHTQIPESTLENLIINKSSVDLNNKPLLTDAQKLSILQALQNFKVLDPACGSGAFPMGILQEICEILEVLDPDAQKFFKLQDAQFQKDNKGKSPSYIRKLAILQNNIYGVDIQPIATEIARLRCFLSLICDEDREHIAPLPNLEFKFVTADTLISIRSDSLEYDGFTQDLQKLESIRQEFFQTTSSKRKDMLKESFQKLRADIGRKITLGGVDNPLPSWDPFDHKQGAEFFDSGYMFGVKSFNLVIGNPPYISNKQTTNKDKLQDIYGFSDDLYMHFFFCSKNLASNAEENNGIGGIISLITPNTFWTTQSKKLLRNMLLDHHIISIINSENPFHSAMVRTCITSFYNTPKHNNSQMHFIDTQGCFNNQVIYNLNQELFKNTDVFFTPTDYNLALYKKFFPLISPLLQQWWDTIQNSKKISKNKHNLEVYRASLKPGDITLLGLITDGGQGLATANNGKYIGVIEGSKEAQKVREQRIEKLYKASDILGLDFTSKQKAREFLESKSEDEIRALFDSAKEAKGRDIFGQGFLFRIVRPEEIADVERLSQEEKLNGIDSKKCFVPYDKGDKDGNQWHLPTPYYIAWNTKNVRYLKEHSGQKGQGMPVMRNPQFYFQEGFCWNNVLLSSQESSKLVKCRIKGKSINDVASMSLYPGILSAPYLVALLNSSFAYEYLKTFINNTVNLQINDTRQIPIKIPNQDELKAFETLFEEAYALQIGKFERGIDNKSALKALQIKLDSMVEKLYDLPKKT